MDRADRLRAIEINSLDYLKDIILIEESADIMAQMYDALWERIELSDRTLPPSGRTPECQRVYDIVRAALAKAEGE